MSYTSIFMIKNNKIIEEYEIRNAWKSSPIVWSKCCLKYLLGSNFFDKLDDLYDLVNENPEKMNDDDIRMLVLASDKPVVYRKDFYKMADAIYDFFESEADSGNYTDIRNILLKNVDNDHIDAMCVLNSSITDNFFIDGKGDFIGVENCFNVFKL